MNCTFERAESEFYACTRCGYVYRKTRTPVLPITRACGPRVRAPDRIRIGDKIERLLGLVGITQERYVALKVQLGLSASCGCDLRREWLNAVNLLNRATMPSWWIGWAAVKTRPAWQPLALLLRRLP